MNLKLTSGRSRARRGMSLVECVIAAGILGVATVAGLRAAASAATTHRKAVERSTGAALAMGLLEEAAAQPYAGSGGSVIKALRGLLLTDKSKFVSVDDYDGWRESPPQDASGKPMAGLSGWTRMVSVDPVDPANLDATVNVETGMKRIRVTVFYDGRSVRQESVFVSDAP
ncbi:MAG: prepilin-type N-terminal cleavage/methylation domain-containing protein [Planctomycetes bacterium]|nr:prepilin-type N-terminal cleavage/methylation domain-containing protein [Planctomycetota bacterium]